MGPSGPTVRECSSLATGIPASVVVGFELSLLIAIPHSINRSHQRNPLTRAIADSGYRNHDLLKDRLSSGAVSSLSEFCSKFLFFAAFTDMMHDVRYALGPLAKVTSCAQRLCEVALSHSPHALAWG